MTEEELAKHDSKTLLQLLLSADARCDALSAERDRLLEALEHIISDCEADYPPSHGAIKYAAKLALKGETP